MQSEVKISEGNLQPGDIVFDCPQCGKSLAIDVRGAGYIVRCPDCQTDIQVPGMESPAEPTAASTEEADAAAVENVSLAERIERLERLRAADAERFQSVSRELVLIQSALDRLVGLVDEAQAGES